jgi:hypothetical protein
MTLTRLTLAAVVLGALTLTACATMQVNSYVERGADVTRYRTYHWAPADARATGDPRLDNNEFFRDRLQAQIDRRLGDRGFEKVTAAGPDLLIHYHASVAQEIDANGADQPYVSCEDCVPYVYEAGTIVVDLVDARTNRLLWRGWAEGSIDGAIDDQTFMERRIDEAVARIMERLPRRL